jgi:hypothetical protein
MRDIQTFWSRRVTFILYTNISMVKRKEGDLHVFHKLINIAAFPTLTHSLTHSLTLVVS